MNIKQLQKEVYKTTIDLGYTVNKKTTLKKLREEFKEFKKVKKQINNDESFHLDRQDKDDLHFKTIFDVVIKDTEHDEIPDMFFVLLSYCEEIGVDFELLVKNKLRYNKLRNKY